MSGPGTGSVRRGGISGAGARGGGGEKNRRDKAIGHYKLESDEKKIKG